MPSCRIPLAALLGGEEAVWAQPTPPRPCPGHAGGQPELAPQGDLGAERWARQSDGIRPSHVWYRVTAESSTWGPRALGACHQLLVLGPKVLDRPARRSPGGPGEENDTSVSQAGAGLVQAGGGAPGASRGPSRRSPVFKAGATVRGLIRTAVSRRRERWPGRSCRSGGFAVSKEKLFLSAPVCRGRLLCAHPEGPVALGMGTSGRRPEREAGPHSHLRELCHLLASPSQRSLHDCLPLPSPPPLKPVLSSGRCPLCSQCSGRFQLRLLH